MAKPMVAEPAFVKLVAPLEPSDGDNLLNKRPPSTDSRSTSAGSFSPVGQSHTVAEEGGPAKVYSPLQKDDDAKTLGLPDYEYPVPLMIRNTFIDTGIPRPISLEGFLEERRIHSCPVQPPPGLAAPESNASAMTQTAMQQALSSGGSMMASVAAAAAAASAAASAATLCLLQRPMAMQCAAAGDITPVCQYYPSTPLAGETTPCSPFPAPGAPVLRLAEALAEPELGTPGIPTKGSVGHWSGNCKPCAFFYTKGCGNGVDCQFCHLCPAGEKKRRQKEKVAVTREMRRWGLLPEE